MIILVAVLILFASALVILTIRLIRPQQPYLWLVSTTSVLLVWLMVLISQWIYTLGTPETILSITWEPDFLFPVSPALILDQISWIYLLVLTSLALAAHLTMISPSNPEVTDRRFGGWAGIVILTGLTCIAVLAGNILTLLIAWAALDMVEALILVRITNERSQRERVVLNYGIRVSGSILVIAAGMVSNISGSAFTFRVIDPVVAILLLIGVGIRLGTIPPNKPLWSADKLDSLEVISRVAPAAASLAILPRLSLSEIDSPWMTVILVLASLAVIYGSLSWLTSQHAKQGISFWMMSVSGLAIIATIMGSRWSSMAWGVSLLLAGGIIFLYHTHHRYLSPLLLIASIGLTSLPYTPTWLGVSSYSTLPSLVGTILLCFQGFILVGYIRHSLNPEPKLGEVERWTWLVYPSGLILLLMVYLWFGYWNGQAMLSAGSNLPTLVESWPSLVIMLTAVLLILLVRITPAISKFSGSPILKLLSFNWLYRLFWSLFYIIRRLFSGFNYILEGQGGLLWAILLLLLLFSIFSRINIGF